MKKGIFFALLFGAFFLLLFSIVIFYASSISAREQTEIANLKFSKYSFITDDISSDLISFLKIHYLTLDRNSTHVIIQINESLPLAYSDAAIELSEYGDFIENKYAGRQNLKGKLSLSLNSVSIAPFIYFNEPSLNYSYSELSKANAHFKGSSSVEEYSLLIESDSVTFDECGWEAFASGALKVNLNIPASNCPLQTVSINALSESKFWANTTTGEYLNISFGNADNNDYSMKIITNGIEINQLLNITYSSSQPLTIWLPAQVDFSGDYTIYNLIIRKI